MEQHEESPSNENASYKRVPKPEEQALVDELAILSAQYGDQFPHICHFVQKEADRIAKGHKSLEEEHQIDVEGGKPVRLTYRVPIPVEKYPNFNYVGRLLGPKGSTLRGMQEISGCKMAILGRGSMRDKEREEQCRIEGGKYAHLNDELHVWIQAFGPPDMAFYKLYVATKEVKKYLHADYNDDIFTEQMMILEQEGVLPKGAVAARGGPRGGRGGRGMMRGMGGRGGGGMMGMSRGGGMMRGGSRGRGGPSRGNGVRGGRGMMRGGGAGGAVATDNLYEDVYEPAPQNFNAGYENGSYAAGGGDMDPGYMGFNQSGPGLDQGGTGMGLMGMKRGIDDMNQPAKYPRRY